MKSRIIAAQFLAALFMAGLAPNPASANQAQVQVQMPAEPGQASAVLSYPQGTCYLPGAPGGAPGAFSPGGKACQFGEIFVCKDGNWEEVDRRGKPLAEVNCEGGKR